MNIFNISWRNLWARPWSTTISLLLLTMGVSIISLLLVLNQQLDSNFKKNIKGIDMVVGAKGSPLQLILSSVYHIDNPTGNISLAEAEKLRNHPLVKSGIPLAFGDNVQGYRILGTEHNYVKHYEGQLAEGSLWENSFEVTLGSVAAERLGLKVGDEFFGAHGLVSDMDEHKSHAYKVVGVLQRSETVLDQLVLTGISSVWEIHEHEEEAKPMVKEMESDEEGHEDHADEDHLAEDDQEITSMLIQFRSPMAMMQLPPMINKQTSMQAALTAIEVNRLFDLFAVGISTIRGIALAIIVISALSVFFSLYNSLMDREYELALMRVLGASRGTLFLLIILEGLLLAVIGFVLGMIMSRLGLWVLSNLVEQNYRYDFNVMSLLPEEGWLFLATLGIGLISALFPAISASNTEISQTLADA